MIRSIYKTVHRAYHGALASVYRYYASFRRADVDSSVIFRGKPLIRCVNGGQLKIASGVKLNSMLRANPIMGNSCCSLSVIHKEAELIIGEDVGMSSTCITAAKSVIIGENTMIGADTLITDTDFHTLGENGGWTNDAVDSSDPVKIGKSCFIGARAIILKGVQIGDNSVVSAGAVVSRDVPSNHLAYGNPAQVKPLQGKWLRK